MSVNFRVHFVIQPLGVTETLPQISVVSRSLIQIFCSFHHQDFLNGKCSLCSSRDLSLMNVNIFIL